MRALIDGDIIVYRCGWTTQDVPGPIALSRVDQSIGKILEFLGSNDYRVYLTSTDHSNFRYEIDKEYKAGRKVEKPTHYHLLRDYLVNMHGAEVITGMEADDALGINQTDETIIVSIDKDLRQIPGKHFNFVKGILDEVSEVDGWRSFYRSLLVGDRTDNISGIYGIGPIGASIAIDKLETKEQMYAKVLEIYKKTFKEKAEETLHHTCSLLYILRSSGDRWKAPE